MKQGVTHRSWLGRWRSGVPYRPSADRRPMALLTAAASPPAASAAAACHRPQEHERIDAQPSIRLGSVTGAAVAAYGWDLLAFVARFRRSLLPAAPVSMAVRRRWLPVVRVSAAPSPAVGPYAHLYDGHAAGRWIWCRFRCAVKLLCRRFQLPHRHRVRACEYGRNQVVGRFKPVSTSATTGAHAGCSTEGRCFIRRCKHHPRRPTLRGTAMPGILSTGTEQHHKKPLKSLSV